jgi:hypothetical protein
MDIVDSRQRPPGIPEPKLAAVLAGVDADYLRTVVERVSIPRPHGSPGHRDVRDWLQGELVRLGYWVARQGLHENLVATQPARPATEILIGAHYDSVAGTPGADDSGSGVASEFRNSHYHGPSDTPDTLDHEFLGRVTRALLLRCLSA